MKIDFLDQTFSDFKAFVGSHRLDWDTPGVTYVWGENRAQAALGANGASKSSLFDALCWCLYGRTPSGLRNPDVIPWTKSGAPLVSVRIKRDGRLHVITRRANSNGILIDDEVVAQEAIDALVGMGFDLFTNTALLAQGKPLFFDLTPSRKMELFSDTLQLDRWDRLSKLASQKTELTETELTNLNTQKSAVTRAVAEVDALLADVRARAQGWADSARRATRDARARVEALQKDHEDKSRQLATAVLREDSASTELRAQEAELRKLDQALTRGRLIIEQFTTALEACTCERTRLKRELEALQEAKTCPTCGQPVKAAGLDKHRAEFRDRIVELETKIAAGIPKKLTTTVKTLETQLELAERHAEGFRGRSDGAAAEANRLRPEVARLATELTAARKAATADAENPFTQQIADLKARRGELAARITVLDTQIAETSTHAERTRFWIKGFKDIKLQLVDDTLQELELVTNGMLEAIGLADWSVRYDIERETKSGSVTRALNVQINSPQSKGYVKWESWSGGEQQRLRLIGALALSDVLLAHAGVQTNLEILDEPAVFFSVAGVQEMCAFLADRAREQGKSIWLVEHQAVESTYFSNTLAVIRGGKGAFLDDPRTDTQSKIRGGGK